LGARVAGHESAGALTQLDDPFVFELAISLGHGIWIDHELLRQRTDARQLLARTQRSRFDAVFHLLHQLQINRHARRGIGTKQHQWPDRLSWLPMVSTNPSVQHNGQPRIATMARTMATTENAGSDA